MIVPLVAGCAIAPGQSAVEVVMEEFRVPSDTGEVWLAS